MTPYEKFDNKKMTLKERFLLFFVRMKIQTEKVNDTVTKYTDYKKLNGKLFIFDVTYIQTFSFKNIYLGSLNEN